MGAPHRLAGWDCKALANRRTFASKFEFVGKALRLRQTGNDRPEVVADATIELVQAARKH